MATEAAIQTPPGNWKKLAGQGVSMRLPDRFVAGDPQKDRDIVTASLRQRGPPFDGLADSLAKNLDDAIRFIAFDSDNPSIGVTALIFGGVDHVSSTTTLDQYVDKVANSWESVRAKVVERSSAVVPGYEAERLALSVHIPVTGGRASLRAGGAEKTLFYAMKLGNNVWFVQLVSPDDGFEERAAILDQAIPTFRNEFVANQSVPNIPATGSAPVCGENASVTLAEGSPIGRPNVAGKPIQVVIHYNAPGCSGASGYISGYHLAGSDWFQYWCVDHPGTATCSSDRVASGFKLYRQPLTGTKGIIGLEALHWTSPSNLPQTDGFIPCFVMLNLDDGTFGGKTAEFDLGERC